MDGYLHSIESMGLVDGPGVRSVVFLSGCLLRCRYCHNPDTWKEGTGTRISPQKLVDKLRRFVPYYRSGGGVTFSGGEPLLQPEFLGEALMLARQAGIHTCIDTSGVGRADDEQYREILANTSLILYDIKHYLPDEYQKLTGMPMDETMRFLQIAQEMKVPMWIRHVVVPGLTDGEEHLAGLREFVDGLSGVERVELLPYHRLGVHKYETMKLPYTLADTPVMNPDVCAGLQKKYFAEYTAK